MENIFSITLSIDWLIELSLESHHKKLPWLGFEPQTWKHGVALTGIRTPDLETWNCLDWDSNPRPGNMELPWLGFEPQTWKTWNLMWNWDCHRLLLHTVFQWVFIRQLALSASTDSWPEIHASNVIHLDGHKESKISFFQVFFRDHIIARQFQLIIRAIHDHFFPNLLIKINPLCLMPLITQIFFSFFELISWWNSGKKKFPPFSKIGVGLGLSFSPSFGVVAFYFDQRKKFATSFMTLSVGVGLMFFPPLERYLIGRYSWRGASLIMSAIALQLVPLSLLFTHRRSSKSQSFAQNADVSLFSKVSFYLMMINFFLMAGYIVINIAGVRFAVQDCGVPDTDAPWILSVQGMFNIAGRFSAMAFGWIRWTGTTQARWTIVNIFTVSTDSINQSINQSINCSIQSFFVMFRYCFVSLCSVTLAPPP